MQWLGFQDFRLRAWYSGSTVGALINGIGFGGKFYCNCKKEPPNPILIIKAPTLLGFEVEVVFAFVGVGARLPSRIYSGLRPSGS